MGRVRLLCGLAFFSTAVVRALSWIPSGPTGSPSVTALATANGGSVLGFQQPSIIFAGVAGAGVLRSDFSGQSWTSTGSGLEGHDPVALAVSQSPFQGIDFVGYDTTVYAGTAGAGVYRLAPNASAWVTVNAGLASLDVRALAVSLNGVVYAGTAGGLFASADSGDTWAAKGSLPSGPDQTISSVAVDPSSPSVLYVGGSGGLFKSTDGGRSWSHLDTGFFNVADGVIGVDPLAPSRVYAAGIASPLCAPLCLLPSVPTSVRSLDGGATWTTMEGLGSSLVRGFAATTNLPAAVFAGTLGGGVFQSLDGGATWAATNEGLGNLSVSSIAIDPNLPSLAFAGTAQGVFRARLGQVALACAPGGQTLCLNGRRFSVSVLWRDPSRHLDNGQALPVTDNSGAFWFYDPTNLELVVKVLDGRPVNGKYWVFYGALTNDEYTITVTDTLTGKVRTYFNPQGQVASVADTSAF